MKNISKKAREKKLYESNDTHLQYEDMGRNENAEKHNWAYKHSIRGICIDYIDGHLVQLWQAIGRIIVLYKRKSIEFLTFCIKGIDILRLFLYNEYCNIKLRKDKTIMSNTNDTTTTNNTKSKAKKSADTNTQSKGQGFWHGIMGIMTLFVIISIAYSSSVIIQGTDDMVHRIMIVPMVAWASVQLVKQFIKQGDK